MIRIRRFEDKCAELYTQEKIRGFLHLYDGEEAVAVGVIPVLEKRDRIVATYREHGHALVRGVPMTTALAEMYGKQEGCSRGRGGSMHLFDRATNFYGGNAIVGGGLPLSVGLALADRMRGEDIVTACFFGDGAVAEGEFHESLNLAALWGAAGAVRVRKQSLRHGNGAGDFGIGNRHPAQGGVLPDRIRGRRRHGRGRRRSCRPSRGACGARDRQALFPGMPHLSACAPHSMFDAQLYRDKAEVEAWRHKEPIVRFQAWLEANHMIHPDDLARIEAEVDGRDRRGGRLRRGRNVGAGRAAHPLHLRRESRASGATRMSTTPVRNDRDHLSRRGA